jgi:hypothetical protein
MSAGDFESIHNYYERLVVQEVLRMARERGGVEARLLADIACVALNRLPPRYIRHEVDFAFYLTDEERKLHTRSVAEAVAYAFDFVLSRAQKRAA